MAGVRLHQFTAGTSELAGWSETWREQHWRSGHDEVWGRGMWADTTKILVSHVNARQRVTAAEEDFNQVDIMALSVHISLFPQSPRHHSVGS